MYIPVVSLLLCSKSLDSGFQNSITRNVERLVNKMRICVTETVCTRCVRPNSKPTTTHTKPERDSGRWGPRNAELYSCASQIRNSALQGPYSGTI